MSDENESKKLGERRRQRLHQRSRSLAASEAAPLLLSLPPPSVAIPSIAEVPLLSAAAPSLLSVPPAMAASAMAGRVSPTPYFHHGHGNGVNPTLLSGDVKASAARLLLPRFFSSWFPHLLFGYFQSCLPACYHSNLLYSLHRSVQFAFSVFLFEYFRG